MRAKLHGRAAVAAAALVAFSYVFSIQHVIQAEDGPPVYFVALIGPGPNAKPGVPLHDHPGIGKHVEYLAENLKKGAILMAGPFEDGSGGMTIWKTATLEEARKAAEGDPAVKSGMLAVTAVKPWVAAMVSK